MYTQCTSQESAKHRAKFGWPPVSDVAAITKAKRQSGWNLLGCPKLPNRSQPLVGRSSPLWGEEKRKKKPQGKNIMPYLLRRAAIKRRRMKKERKIETTGVKYNGLPITIGGHNKWNLNSLYSATETCGLQREITLFWYIHVIAPKSIYRVGQQTRSLDCTSSTELMYIIFGTLQRCFVLNASANSALIITSGQSNLT